MYYKVNHEHLNFLNIMYNMYSRLFNVELYCDV